jgi:hypothetical protein
MDSILVKAKQSGVVAEHERTETAVRVGCDLGCTLPEAGVRQPPGLPAPGNRLRQRLRRIGARLDLEKQFQKLVRVSVPLG